jgi:MoaA/NifB/PqqE/SkfB family radical SAM enzyme
MYQNQPLSFLDEQELPYPTPVTVDLNVTGTCNLKCVWCWGPDHRACNELSVDQWKKIIYNLWRGGTRNVTITGGEPLLKKGLVEILRYLHEELSMRVTLSTNGLLLGRMASTILPYVDDIGLPLDGHTKEVQDMMRPGVAQHFDVMIGNISFVQQNYPQIRLTVRTVVSRKNAQSVPLIGKIMVEAGVDPKHLRWKCYQIAPIGIRKQETLQSGWFLEKHEFEEIMRLVQEQNPQFPQISILSTKMHAGRYFHVYPNGESHVFITGEDGLPERKPLGNLDKDLFSVIERLKEFDLTNNQIRYQYEV